jgi:hypothetical protein
MTSTDMSAPEDDQNSPTVTATTTDAEAAEQINPGDIIVARMERLPFTRKHWAIAVLLAAGTFFDGFDSLIIGS